MRGTAIFKAFLRGLACLATLSGASADLIEGDNGVNSITGTSNPDIINAFDGNDTVSGGGGGDLIIGGGGFDTLFGEGGADLIWGFYDYAWSVWSDTAGDDFIGGTGNDTFVGGLGPDTYYYDTGDGDDWIYDPGNPVGLGDWIVFGSGIASTQVFYSRIGADLSLEDSVGAELLRVVDWYADYANSSFQIEWMEFADSTIWANTAFGLLGTLLEGTSGAETLTGQNGVDELIYGYEGNDNIYGRSGDDLVVGGPGNDTMWGEDGDDTLDGGPGDDTISGRKGSDVYIYRYGEGDDVLTDYYPETSTPSRLRFGVGIAPDDIVLTMSGGDLVATVNDYLGLPTGSVKVRYWTTNYGGVRHHDNWSLEFIDGTIWEGDALGTESADYLYGDDGGADSINGGAGNDYVYGYAGNDLIYGGDGNDTVYAGNDDDTIYGGDGADTLRGENGDDQIYGQAGDDTLYGAGGDDTYYWDPGDGDDLISDQYNGGTSDTNRLVFGPAVDPEKVSLAMSGTDLVITLYDYLDDEIGTITIDQWSFVVSGTTRHQQTWEIEFDDGTIWEGGTLGTESADNLYGGSWAETIYAGGGNDYVYSYGGNDIVYGGAGTDVVYGGDDHDQLFGEDGNDTLRGENGNDELFGGAGDDTLIASNGDDQLVGGSGDDDLLGGYGSDAYTWAPSDGNDVLDDAYSEHGVDNVVVIEGLDSAGQLEFAIDGYHDLMITVSNWAGTALGSLEILDWARLYGSNYHYETWTLEVDGIGTYSFNNIPTSGADTVTADATDDAVIGWTGNDVLDGANGNDLVHGGAGTDTLSGGNGADVLVGGAGNDTLYGQSSIADTGDSPDFLHGGTGDDTLYGSEGDDAYSVGLGDGDDVIYEPDSIVAGEQNELRFGIGIDPDSVVVTKSVYDLIIEYDGAGSTVTIKDWFADSERSSGLEWVSFANGALWITEFTESRVGLTSGGGGVPSDPGLLNLNDVNTALSGYSPSAASELTVLTPLR